MPKLGMIIKWLVIAGAYIGLVNLEDIGFFVFFCLTPLAGLIMFFTIIAYSRDKSRDNQTRAENFTAYNLLYRYGVEVKNTSLVIPFKSIWRESDVEKFIVELHTRICGRVEDEFVSLGVLVSNLEITDNEKNESRSFSKIMYRTNRGSFVSHFLHFSKTGKAIVTHYLSFIRGTYEWYHVLDFVITSPISVWSWGYRWINNQFSITAELSGNVSKSYDKMDVRSFYLASYNSIMVETEAVLKEHDLLSEELQQIIVNNITNAPQISVNNSPGTVLDRVANIFQEGASQPVA